MYSCEWCEKETEMGEFKDNDFMCNECIKSFEKKENELPKEIIVDHMDLYCLSWRDFY